ncbi:NRDE family protein [Microbacterium saccharophilum]|uniref:NRDE family protein n=1 Tax=Microbacterium saccharophilum TaxID=1213358 RepID=A0A5C8I1Y5_9MICO|nr:NRDE family protein [Microbacterium saccharophilum]TXK11562.1 NRDE family protein [Microbacterium saccharophilum]GEP48628.1 hypothetical protein MSA03_21360 [Microbacterium saccharophilum]
MCTVIIHVPEDAGAPTRLLAVRDEDPGRAWDPLGPWWPEAHPGVLGVRDSRAGGAWLAADPVAGRVAVILNRADVDVPEGVELSSRGHVVLDAVGGTALDDPPHTHGFNLVEVDQAGARVTMWDGATVRRVRLAPGTHMIAHDDIDDPTTARIAAWREAFGEPGDGERWWAPWLATLEQTTALGPTDDRAIIRDNRPFGYPTLSLLVCAASVSADGAEVVYGELDEPGAWNTLQLR